ncbi:MAG: DUF2723 domain-containing protein [Bacteroidota bacterium]
MSYERINNLTGWGVFLAALLVYLLTVAPTASFWDCGEFIACANELEVTHPPGAPLFLLLGRIFALFAFGDVSMVAFMVNLLSVFAGAFTALFTCWITTILARKGLAQLKMDEQSRTIAILAAGVVAGLTCTFADSVWFNSVEAEVYSLSSFFTAIVVWLMFKWEARADEPDHLRWIVLIAYIMGLSIGVHLLNLLTIPALALLYYYRKFDFTWLGFLATMGISVVILAVIQYGIIQEQFEIAWAFERWLTGTMSKAGQDLGGLGLPVGTGATLYAVLLIGSLVALLYVSHQKRMLILNTAVLASTVIMIGFSSYGLIFMRSNVDPPIDMNNPENILTFLSYMRREQYGDRPLLYGPLYNAELKRDSRGYPETKDKGMKYVLLEGKEKYVEDTKDVEYQYKQEKFFPRMYEASRYDSGPFGYKNFVKNQGGDPNSPYDDQPTNAEDIRFFFQYQLNHMYFRYFMWNFAGRESDIQDSRWESGLEFGTASKGRYTWKKSRNKGKNHYYFLPLLLGLLGVVWQSISRKQDAAVIGMLFFFTGIAIIIYLNQYPAQPRERDYSFAGSFQTFAIWVGLGVAFLSDLLYKRLGKAAVWIAAGVAMLAPLLMGVQNWDDHTRKGRWVDIEFAKNMLNSCAPNAILFTGGDNDTFPLWYVQEVEGYRTDVRVVNLELLISDWYIDLMRQPKNESEGLPIHLDKADYAGEEGLVIYNYPARTIDLPFDRQTTIQNGVLTPQEAALAPPGPMVWEFKNRGSQNNPYILRKDSVIIEIMRNVAADGWKRPVYFGNTMSSTNFMGLTDYFRLEGMAYRVVPIKRSARTPNDVYYGWIQQDTMFQNLTDEFLFTGLDDPSVNLDEHIRNVIIGNYRNAFFRLANSYAEQIFAINGQIAQVQQQLAEGTSPDSLPDPRVMAQQIEARQQRIQTLVQVSREKMPPSVIDKPSALIMSELQMLDKAGLPELAKEDLDAAIEASLHDLVIEKSLRRNIDPRQSLDMRTILVAIQYLTRNGLEAEAGELAQQLKEVTGSDIGTQVIQQELFGK